MVALSANAVYEPWNRRTHALAHADRIAEAIGLDVAAAAWSPTVDNYLGRVTKARILQAVREARGVAERGQELLTGSGWLPEPLRTPQTVDATTSLSSESSEISPDSPAGEESATTGCETAMADSELPDDKFVAA